jgi:hypothetical protein
MQSVPYALKYRYVGKSGSCTSDKALALQIRDDSITEKAEFHSESGSNL